MGHLPDSLRGSHAPKGQIFEASNLILEKAREHAAPLHYLHLTQRFQGKS
jgi:hypothetical protein